MPYASNATLPEAVRAALPEAAQSVFLNVFNEREASGDSEQASIRQAWGAVKNGWEKRDGQWVRKVAKAEYQGRQVELDKPFRLPSGSSKKFGVYVKDGDSVKRVTFGDPDMEIRRDDDEARANFRARHSCDAKTDKTTPGYWACRTWEADFTVSEVLSKSEASREFSVDVKKSSEELGLVFGWAIISEIDGEPYYDLHNDHIPHDVALKALAKFMQGERTAKAMHQGERVGTIDMAFPMTPDIMKALGIESNQTGIVIAMRPDPEIMAKFRSGEYRAFSIGGRAVSVNAND